MKRYNPFEIEAKWQKKWAENNSFKTGTDESKEHFYCLEMFPYPSGNLHVGHLRNYCIGDTVARYKNLNGFNVLHPMGWDSLGMPAENAALKNNSSARDWTAKSIEGMKKVMNVMGMSYDWDRELTTYKDSYYGHQQAFFIDMFKKGLVYKKEAMVNWDPVDMTVLANEQVIDGKGWRSDAVVERKMMDQWFLNITKYGDELLDDISELKDWPERVKHMQVNWIGKSEGLQFKFVVAGSQSTKELEVYTTRPDTIMGITFASVASEHPLAKEIAKTDPKAAEFIKECQALGTSAVDIETAEKKGYKTPYTVVHPITKEEFPIYIANFVLMAYGTGAVMAVPAHDERDFDFAKKYDIEIKQVIAGNGYNPDEAYTEYGTLVNSGEFDGLSVDEAKIAVIAKFEDMKIGNGTTNFKLRDWGISRQRYWGTPIPFVECDECGTVPVNKEDLPVKLPDEIDINVKGNPLASDENFVNTTCPKCGKSAKRTTDTMDTFMDSSWYFLRFACPHSKQVLDVEEVKKWLPVDSYIGGIEHAILHLLYSRFITKVLRDLGYVNDELKEPFKRLITQGMVLAHSFQDAEGNYINPTDTIEKSEKFFHKETGVDLKVNRMVKISKSKNNGKDTQILFDEFGADAVRTAVIFVAPVEKDLEWTESALEGCWRFMGRFWNLVHKTEIDFVKNDKIYSIDELDSKEEKDLKRLIHKTIKRVTDDLDRFQLNTVVAAAMELSNALAKVKATDSEKMQALYVEGVKTSIKLFNPIAPHITEEMWEDLGNTEFLTDAVWPKAEDSALIDDEITLVVQVNGKLKAKMQVPASIEKSDAEAQAQEAVAEFTEGKEIKRVIYVPGRLVNIVIG
ncbi:MAG: leucine--tRNA ligase [Proteobacteria bacterium]|nr:leucine--tRNA ligase [Pseudomonadota bacterium]